MALLLWPSWTGRLALNSSRPGYYLNQIGTSGADADGFADAQGPEFRFPVAADFDEDGDIDIASGDRWYPNQFDESGTDDFGQPEKLLRTRCAMVQNMSAHRYRLFSAVCLRPRA
jgi:hypothetical protein